MTSSSKMKPMLSSAEAIGSNHDILNEILLGIPAKPLLKFKCVCKQWFSLISNPEFCLSHARRQHSPNPTPNALLLNNQYTPTPEFQVVPLQDTTKVPFLDYLNVPRTYIHQSCNGLLLCSSAFLCNPCEQRWKQIDTGEWVPVTSYYDIEDYCGFVVNDNDRGHRFFIVNPTTKQFKRIPLPSYSSKQWGPYVGPFLNLAFDPLKSPYYKVISLGIVDVHEDEYVIDVYSSETESWTVTGIAIQLPSAELCRSGVFCNGAIHWRSHPEALSYFEVGLGTLKTMPLPLMTDADGQWLSILYFGESCGHLHVIATIELSDFPLQFDIWEMAPDYSGWSVLYHVDQGSLLSSFFPEQSSHHMQSPTAFSVLSVIQAENEEESKIVLFLDGGRVVSYNPCDTTSTKLCDLEPRPVVQNRWCKLDYKGVDAYQYFESLVCI